MSPGRRSAAVATLVVALVGVAAGCGGNDAVAVEDLSKVVLQPEDLPGFQLFDVGRQARADLPAGERADPGRFGRKGGWKARFRRPGSPATRGPLVVESRADVFGNADGAAEDLKTHRAQLEMDAELVEAPEIGDEAIAMTLTQEAALANVRFYTVAWRQANVTASVTVQGFDGKIAVDDALALARKQQRRIEAAAD